MWKCTRIMKDSFQVKCLLYFTYLKNTVHVTAQFVVGIVFW